MLCDCLGEYCRRIGNDDLALFYGGKVEIVITDRIIGYDLQFFSSCVEYLRVNLVSQKRQDGRCTLDESCKLAGLESSRVLADFDRETIPEQFQSRVRNLSGYNNDWFSFTHVLDFPKLYHKAPHRPKSLHLGLHERPLVHSKGDLAVRTCDKFGGEYLQSGLLFHPFEPKIVR